MSAADWLQLVLHFATLSLLGIGGAITTLPDMHRYLVDRQLWLSDAQFNASVALAQAAPGPNILFVALMGWHVGINAGGGWLARSPDRSPSHRRSRGGSGRLRPCWCRRSRWAQSLPGAPFSPNHSAVGMAGRSGTSTPA